jgi:endonuclease G
MKNHYLIFLLLTGLISAAHAQYDNIHFERKIKDIEIPKVTQHDAIVKHLAYTLSYNEKHEQANWVAYELTRNETIKHVNRSNQFNPDPSVKTGSADDIDYSHSGYDRGHLAPAADMAWSEQSMRESFYYSNMSPQNPSFNRGIWKHLEEQVRNWAIAYNQIYVVTGPVLKPGLFTIGPNHVSIPEAYYKVLLQINDDNEINGIGFIMPNEGSKLPIQTYAFTIDSVEKITGIDFFDKLPDDIENELESTVCGSCWTWNQNHQSSIQQTNYSNRSQSENQQAVQGERVQCSGITKAGNRCKRTTTNASGRCFQH